MAILTSVVRANLRAIKNHIHGGDIEAIRSLQDRAGGLMSMITAREINNGKPFSPGRFSAAFCEPKSRQKRGCVLYLHGGSYTAGSLTYAMGFGGVLCAEIERRILCAAYRLAPEQPFPAALEDALCAYEYLMTEVCPAEEILLCGESAGGGLIMSLTLKLIELGKPLPRALCAISPWLDLTLSGASYSDNEKRDPSLVYDDLHSCALYYAGGRDLCDPFISPLFGNFSGFPKTLIIAGGDELLLSDSSLCAERMYAAGTDVKLHIEPGLWHAYPLYGLSESKRALSMISDFFDETVADDGNA